MKKILFPASSLLMIVALVLVSGTSEGSEKITVMNPAITNTMADRVPLTKRLDSLEDKTIYMVDINWGGPDAAYSVFEEMQIWFSKNMPSVKTVLKRKSGSYSTDDPGLWKEISEKGDAAIIGISGWDGCTSAVSQHCKTLEKDYQIPTVGAAASNIVAYARGYNFLYTNGMPIRYVGFPFPVAGQPKSVHRQYIEGNDVVSGKPMMTAIIDALTKPLTEEEKYSGPPPEAAPEPRFLKPDTADNLQRLFKEKDWTDYNPIILPTEEKVKEILAGTSRKPDEIIKYLTWPGGKRPFTVEKAAICAVMAGAKPEYFPLILAVATQVPFGNSTSSMANMIVVNGPIRNELGMNYGGNALGPHNEVNAVIGRVFTLMSKTAGNLHHGKTTFSSLGSNLQYNNLCFAENEEGLPEGWEPLHVQMGFKPNDSVVTVGIGWTYISSVGEVQKAYPAHFLMRDYMRSLTAMMGGTVLMDPTVAALLKHDQGFQTKHMLSEWLADNVEKTVASFWGNGVVSTFFGSMAIQGLEPYASYLKMPGEKLIKPMTAEGIQIVVVGGGIQTTWFVTDFMLGRGVLVDEWR